MDFTEKVCHFRDEMEYLGVSEYSAAPFLYRGLWAIGILEPPPFFTGFLRSLLVQILCFAFIMLSILFSLHYIFALHSDITINLFAIIFLFSTAYSFFMTISYRQLSKILELPSWELYLSEKHKVEASNIS